MTEVSLHYENPPSPFTPETEDIEANELSDQVEDGSQHHAPEQQNAAAHVQGGTGSADGEGQKLLAEQTVPGRKATWCPWWLQPAVFVIFAGTFSSFIIALCIMIWYSHNHAGLLNGGVRFGNLWRLSSTAGKCFLMLILSLANVITIVLTVISVFWARVELQSKRYMPWISAIHAETPDTVDYNLDYISMMLPTVLVKSFRQKHYLVFLVAVTSIPLIAQIVLAPSLFLVTRVQFRQPNGLKILDTFNTEPGRSVEDDARV